MAQRAVVEIGPDLYEEWRRRLASVIFTSPRLRGEAG
jgi:hypothetical protein